MWIRRFSAALFLGWLLAAGLAGSLRTADANSHVFTVSGVPVDVTAETAAAAREAAHAEGHVKAMEKLLARFLPRAEIAQRHGQRHQPAARRPGRPGRPPRVGFAPQHRLALDAEDRQHHDRLAHGLGMLQAVGAQQLADRLGPETEGQLPR